MTDRVRWYGRSSSRFCSQWFSPYFSVSSISESEDINHSPQDVENEAREPDVRQYSLPMIYTHESFDEAYRGVDQRKTSTVIPMIVGEE